MKRVLKLSLIVVLLGLGFVNFASAATETIGSGTATMAVDIKSTSKGLTVEFPTASAWTGEADLGDLTEADGNTTGFTTVAALKVINNNTTSDKSFKINTALSASAVDTSETIDPSKIKVNLQWYREKGVGSGFSGSKATPSGAKEIDGGFGEIGANESESWKLDGSSGYGDKISAGKKDNWYLQAQVTAKNGAITKAGSDNEVRAKVTITNTVSAL